MTDAIDRGTTRWLLVLYAANSFLFLVLSFFFLPDPIVKVVGSAGAVVFGLLGLKSLNPREADTMSLVRRHRSLIMVALLLIALLQAILLALGFANPCRIVAIPGSTVTVDGKFFARTPDPTAQQGQDTENMYSPANIRPWLIPQQTTYRLRWDTHEIRISKKWYVDDGDRSEVSVKNVSVNLAKLWNPKEAFRDWIMRTDQKPFLKISYGIKEQPAEADNLALARQMQLAVENWDRLWLKAMDQKDDLPHNRTEPYVAALQVVQDHETAHVEFQIRDWTDHPLKALRPILDINAEQFYTPLDKIQRNVFGQLLGELAIQGRAIKLSPADKLVAGLTQSLIVSAVTTEPLPPGEGPPASPPSTATVTGSASPASSATQTSNSTEVVAQLQSLATDALANNQLDSAVAVQQQLQATLDQVRTQSASKQTTELLESANAVIKKAIKDKSRRGRIYMHIANQSQRQRARELQAKLEQNQFVVIGIQNVAGRAYIPDTAEVCLFAFPNLSTPRQAAEDIVEILKKNGVNAQATYVIPSEREIKESSDINTHFEIWFARDSFAVSD